MLDSTLGDDLNGVSVEAGCFKTLPEECLGGVVSVNIRMVDRGNPLMDGMVDELGYFFGI
jgi:hypothetical protein